MPPNVHSTMVKMINFVIHIFPKGKTTSIENRKRWGGKGKDFFLYPKRTLQHHRSHRRGSGYAVILKWWPALNRELLPSDSGLPRWLSGKDPNCQRTISRRRGFNSWVGKILRRKKWLPTPVFLPGESHGQRNLAGYSPWGCKEVDVTERLGMHTAGALRKAAQEGSPSPRPWTEALLFPWEWQSRAWIRLTGLITANK